MIGHLKIVVEVGCDVRRRTTLAEELYPVAGFGISGEPVGPATIVI
jgi:hypothetical protein